MIKANLPPRRGWQGTLTPPVRRTSLRGSPYTATALARLDQTLQALSEHKAAEAKREAYPDARKRLIVDLAAAGWSVNDHLKYPRATPPGGGSTLRLYIHPRAVHFKVGKWPRTRKPLSLFSDIRGLSADDLIHEARLLEIDFL